MRVLVVLICLVPCFGCQPDTIKQEDVEIVSDCKNVIVEDLFPPDTIFRDTVIIPDTIINYEIDDYYSYFFGTSVNDIKKNSREDAFNNGSFILNEINYQKGYISFRTQNTPLDMDGDSETEDGYEIT